MDMERCIQIREATLRNLRLLSKETGRSIANDLADDLILLGIEEYRRVLENVQKCNSLRLPSHFHENILPLMSTEAPGDAFEL